MAQADPIMSPPLRVVVPKPRMTIYYALLIIALIAMLLACLFMYLEIRRFGGFGTVSGRVTAIEHSELLRYRAGKACAVNAVDVATVNSMLSLANT